MTSTPVSLNDESLNGSWIDINSASQIHSPMDDDSPEFTRPPHSLAGSAQNLGLISFQVERYLQEAQKNTNTQQQDGGQQQQQQQYPNIDNISDICLSDSDLSTTEELAQGSKALLDNLRRHHNRTKNQQHNINSSNSNDNNSTSMLDFDMSADNMQQSQRLFKIGDCLVDQLSDSLSILSRASMLYETGIKTGTSGSDQNATANNQFQDFEWLWDWTAQPEFFTGQEWKVCAPKQDYLLRQKQIYCASLPRGVNGGHERYYSGDIMSLLFLTNILSIIIGAGITYSMLMRRSNI